MDMGRSLKAIRQEKDIDTRKAECNKQADSEVNNLARDAALKTR